MNALAKDESRVWFLKACEVPEVGGLTVFVACHSLANGDSPVRHSHSQDICLNRRVIQTRHNEKIDNPKLTITHILDWCCHGDDDTIGWQAIH